MKTRLLKLAGLGVVVGFLGFVVAASGIIPIKASAGHWPITRWFLSFSMRRSVETHTIGTKVPSLDEPWMVLKGAATYDASCSPCHGAPGQSRSDVLQELTPHPPRLAEVVGEWEPAELFYIVKHGVKLTGMPAWPVRHRDDEVWAMVAFLRMLPSLEADTYRRLALGPMADSAVDGSLGTMGDAPPQVLESCARCHGLDGHARGAGAFPRLAGQPATYLAAALEAYARERRESGIMQPVAAELTREEIVALAAWYAALPPGEAVPVHDTVLVEAGERIVREGILSEKVAACESCHGPHGRVEGTAGPASFEEPAHNAHYPVLAGQYPEYLALQLRLFRDGHRGGGPYAHIMHEVASQLTDEHIAAVAAYYGSRPPHRH